MKADRVLPIVVLILALVLGATLAGCSLTGETTTTAGQSTTTTVAGQTTPADTAIAAIVKSTVITTPQTVKAGTLLAGSDASFPPLEFAKQKGGYQGFDVDLCTAIAKKLGLQLEIVPKEYKGLVSSLVDDNLYDIVMAGLVTTPDLTAKMAFTEVYLPAVLSITSPSGSPIADAAGLAGKVVGVQKGTLAESELAKVSGIGQISRYDRILDAFADMDKGTLNAVVIDRLISSYILTSFESYKGKFANTGSIDTGLGYGYALKTGNTALLTAINAAITELRTDGVYKLICEKWGVTGN